MEKKKGFMAPQTLDVRHDFISSGLAPKREVSNLSSFSMETSVTDTHDLFWDLHYFHGFGLFSFFHGNFVGSLGFYAKQS